MSKRSPREPARLSRAVGRRRWIKREPVTDLGHRIVSATVEEFAAKGILGSRVAEITRRAGTTDPAFYRYFAGLKPAALFILSEYYWKPLNVRLDHYRQITDSPSTLFEAVVESLIQSTADDPTRPWLAESRVFRIVVTEMRSPLLLPESMLDAEYLEFIRFLERVVRRGQRDALFSRRFSASLLAHLVVHTLHQVLMLGSLPSPPIRLSMDQVREVARLLVRNQRKD